MSRSYKKFPVHCNSKKFDKQTFSRMYRHRVKQELNQGNIYLLPLPNEVYDFWWSGNADSCIAFDPIKYPHMLRK